MDKATVIDTPAGIEAFRLLSIRGRLRMELQGITFRRIPGYGSTFSYVKKTWNLRGNKEYVLQQFNNMLKDKGILRD